MMREKNNNIKMITKKMITEKILMEKMITGKNDNIEH